MQGNDRVSLLCTVCLHFMRPVLIGDVAKGVGDHAEIYCFACARRLHACNVSQLGDDDVGVELEECFEEEHEGLAPVWYNAAHLDAPLATLRAARRALDSFCSQAEFGQML